MVEFLDFAARHWYLFAALFVILGLWVGGEVSQTLSAVKRLNPQGALLCVNENDGIFLDVRQPDELKGGFIQNAVHIPLGELNQRQKEIARFKEKNIVVYCNTGSRADQAAKQLAKDGFTAVHVLAGGFPAWAGENLPVRRKK